MFQVKISELRVVGLATPATYLAKYLDMSYDDWHHLVLVQDGLDEENIAVYLGS